MASNGQASVDIKGLKKLYANNGAAKAAFEYFATRKNNANATKVDRLEVRLRQAGHEMSRREVVAFLKELEKLGCGEFKTGRRGQPSRFEWTAQLLSVAKAAKGEENSVAGLEPTDIPANEEDDAPAGTIRHPYRLRQDLSISLDLPANLTAKEAVRLAEFIKTLPFDAANGV